ncbi:MAG TPA: hypothetical protein VNT24_03515 [Propionibacteriaceae bacterium]|nr:hypothetical protein [Propionibacteriaceae bacterium]
MIALLWALVVAGCGARPAGPGTATAGPPSGSAASGPAAVGSAAVGSADVGSPIAADRIPVVCAAWVDADAAGARVLLNADLGSGTPEQVQAIVQAFWSAQEPILASMEPAPEPIKAEVGKVLAVARDGASTGDADTFGSPELVAADRRIDEYILRECGYQQIQVIATDHAYQGLPSAVRSGAVGIRVDNQGQDVHQVLIIRANDGVTQPFSEMLELPPEQRGQLATPLGSIEVEPGETSTVFLRLTPGRYGAVDLLAQGTTSFAAPGDGPPHFSLGMQGEFTAT